MACENYFDNESDKDFKDEIRKYPCLRGSKKNI